MTTVARLIPRFYDVLDGCVEVDGVDVREVRLRDLRKAVGIVFEDTFLFSDSIAGNLPFDDPDADAESIRRATRLAGSAESIGALPGGYATPIAARGCAPPLGPLPRIARPRAILPNLQL